VIIPAYRAEATLDRALNSALGQTIDDVEVIVVDDASGDGSWELVLDRMRHDPRLRAIQHRHNCGKPIAMNRAIETARGRWIAVLDADDWYHPDRLAALIALGEAAGADLVADNQFFFDARADRMLGSAWRGGPTHWPLTFDDYLAGADAYRNFNLGMLKPVVRADFIRRTGLEYEEQARNGQDFFYILRFFLLGGTALVADQPYYCYTQAFGRASRQWSHAERRRYDFATALRINRQFARIAAVAATATQRERLDRRSRQLRSLECFFQIKECLAAGKPIGALARIVRWPPVCGYVFRRALARLQPQRERHLLQRIADRARPTRPEHEPRVAS
jgi:succinoglycan biosynthesis protein ExoO